MMRRPVDALNRPAAVFGTSRGSVYALCLMVRYPRWVPRVFDVPRAGLVPGRTTRRRLAPLAVGAEGNEQPVGSLPWSASCWPATTAEAGYDGAHERLRAAAGASSTLSFEEAIELLRGEGAGRAAAPVRLLISEDGLHLAVPVGSASGWASMTAIPGTRGIPRPSSGTPAQSIRPFLREVAIAPRRVVAAPGSAVGKDDTTKRPLGQNPSSMQFMQQRRLASLPSDGLRAPSRSQQGGSCAGRPRGSPLLGRPGLKSRSIRWSGLLWQSAVRVRVADGAKAQIAGALRSAALLCR